MLAYLLPWFGTFSITQSREEGKKKYPPDKSTTRWNENSLDRRPSTRWCGQVSISSLNVREEAATLLTLCWRRETETETWIYLYVPLSSGPTAAVLNARTQLFFQTLFSFVNFGWILYSIFSLLSLERLVIFLFYFPVILCGGLGRLPSRRSRRRLIVCTRFISNLLLCLAVLIDRWERCVCAPAPYSRAIQSGGRWGKRCEGSREAWREADEYRFN